MACVYPRWLLYWYVREHPSRKPEVVKQRVNRRELVRVKVNKEQWTMT